MPTRRLPAVLSTALLLLVVAVPPAPTLAAASVTLTANEIAFRQSFGLTLDPSTISSARTSALAASDLARFGAALTDSERADVEARFALQPALVAYAAAVDAVPGIGGFYVDQANGGGLVLQATAVALPAVEALIALRPAGTTARVDVVAHAASELTAVKERLMTDWSALEARGVPITVIAPDVPGNRLEVGIHPWTATAAEFLTAYGPDLIEVTDVPPASDSSCNSRKDCANPLKGGLEIDSSLGAACTAGFIVSNGYGGNALMLTAGHCSSGRTGVAWYHHSVGIGSTTATSWYQNSPAEVEQIDIPDNQKSNIVYQAPTIWMYITAEAGSDYVGEGVCNSGITTGTTCGTIHATHVAMDWGGYHFTSMVEATYRSQSGDSGGPVYQSQGSVAEGIHFGSIGTYAAYSFIWYAEQALPGNLRVCRNSSCT